MEHPTPIFEVVATKQEVELPIPIFGVGAIDEEIEPSALILEIVSLGVDMPLQGDIELHTAESMALVLEEGVDPTVEESLLQKSVAPEVEAPIPIVSSKVTFSYCRDIEPGAPIANSFLELT